MGLTQLDAFRSGSRSQPGIRFSEYTLSDEVSTPYATTSYSPPIQDTDVRSVMVDKGRSPAARLRGASHPCDWRRCPFSSQPEDQQVSQM